MAYQYFLSYSRANTKHPADEKLFNEFVEELEAEVGQTAQPPLSQEVGFVDRTDIEVGAIWTAELENALRTSRVAVALYSPNYFASQWCGKEFQIFLDRAAKAGPPGTVRAIIPVPWIAQSAQSLPPQAAAIQYDNAAFPADYAASGLRQIMKTSLVRDQFPKAIDALAKAINAAAKTNLPHSMGLSLTNVPSAWAQNVKKDSHKEGTISKSCFVFVATAGWHWTPYPSNPQKIGAIAQQISGKLGLQYEEIPCDGNLAIKLKDTYENRVPTLIFGDPMSLWDPSFRAAMSDYDQVYYLNCGAIVPWGSSESAEQNFRALQQVLPQKVASPPPDHEWRSIFSIDDLTTRTNEIIEKIRLRLLQTILASSQGSLVSTIATAGFEANAAKQGIRHLDVAPQVASVSPPA